MRVVGVEVQMEIGDAFEDVIGVVIEVESEFADFIVGTLVYVWLVRDIVDDEVGVCAGLMMNVIAVGDGVFVIS